MDLRVTVVGAGIGGMATSLLLARAGASVVLLERVGEVAAVGAGLLLQANGLAVLSGLGLDEELRAGGFLSAGVPVRAADGTVISSLPVPDFGEGLDRVLAVRRSAVHEALLAAVQASPGVELRLGVEVGGRESFDTDVVVGADGVASAVRSGGDFGARVRPTGAVYLRGLVPLAGDGFAGEYWTPSGLFGGAPVDATTQYFYASATAPAVRAAVTARDLSALGRAWAAALPAAATAFDAVGSFDDLLVNEVVRVDCARWADGRRVLLGDAAHAMAPNAGQGANSALVDAAVLAYVLERAATVEAALAAYTARRRPRVRRVQDAADRLAQLAHWHGRTTTRVRDGLLRFVDRRAGLADRLVRSTLQEDPAALRGLVRGLDLRSA
ncbi:FAD-dependent oxidoreductase [Petropleomorpha daqingensis]|uniref:2-polyprenyl-6-methoxyphenol hydroxylase-like FAD-dependent oxidoreductase n=1 Tax=Petropleomorpha daqingensis TaxID=2026353 RepID=A0A853CQ72_9ACTN|nr:NAD(P)/FAD-dependent oxidoreductase [Petropleomorpha daqingensis]NYJ08348.1 2-polyprenyl-6-methoxyphenol hydroxylase-like FAD-dependent oxidoreductase [Petropleomorpha daqingensis]